MLDVSVVIPAYDAEPTLAATLRSLVAQSLARDRFEIVVVDDGSRDRTAAIAADLADRVVRRTNGGAAAARNAGIAAARGDWIAFTDADCVASRGWLAALLQAAAAASDERPALGAAGRTVGLESSTAAARFVDLTGGLDPQRYLAHPRFPFAPTSNVLYRRDALLSVGGFDERFRTYEACDLHERLRRRDDAPFALAPRAVVFHRHRASWRAYWRQQLAYGVGYAQFVRSRRAVVPWGAVRELRAWAGLAALGVAALQPGGDDAALVRRGTFLKHAAQRIGFATTYWRPSERRRWSDARYA